MRPPDPWSSAVGLTENRDPVALTVARALVEDDGPTAQLVRAAFRLGFEAGHRDGVLDGWTEGLHVLDEAGAFLARLQPWKALEAEAARARRGEHRAPAGPVPDPRRCLQSWAAPVGAT